MVVAAASRRRWEFGPFTRAAERPQKSAEGSTPGLEGPVGLRRGVTVETGMRSRVGPAGLRDSGDVGVWNREWRRSATHLGVTRTPGTEGPG